MIVISWLLARLWWGLEISRLTLWRSGRKAAQSRIAHSSTGLPPSHWVLDGETFYCLSVNEPMHRMVVTEMPGLDVN